MPPNPAKTTSTSEPPALFNRHHSETTTARVCTFRQRARLYQPLCVSSTRGSCQTIKLETHKRLDETAQSSYLLIVCLCTKQGKAQTTTKNTHKYHLPCLGGETAVFFSAGTTPTPVRIVSLILSTARHAERQRRTLVRGNNYSRYPNSQAGGSFTSKQHQARRSSA